MPDRTTARLLGSPGCRVPTALHRARPHTRHVAHLTLLKRHHAHPQTSKGRGLLCTQTHGSLCQYIAHDSTPPHYRPP